MTIKKYLNNLPEMPGKNGETLRSLMLDSKSVWSNDACIGYCAYAMRAAGCEVEQMAEIIRQLKLAFDALSVEQAEEIGKA